MQAQSLQQPSSQLMLERSQKLDNVPMEGEDKEARQQPKKIMPVIEKRQRQVRKVSVESVEESKDDMTEWR